MKKNVLCALLALLAFLQTGCSTHFFSNINGRSVSEFTATRFAQENNADPLWKINGQIQQQRICRIKYHPTYFTSRFMVVEGKIGTEHNRYPIILDTGASQSVFVKDTHVIHNRLHVYPTETGRPPSNSYDWRLCFLPELQIGDISLINWPCFYLRYSIAEKLLKLLGLSEPEDNFIIVGLPALQQFKYIMFDNINAQAELSRDKTFEPQEPQLWEQYPLSIEQDFAGNMFLFVKISIAGEDTELQLDTGNGNGLAIREQLWGEIRSKIRKVNLKNGSDLYPYIGRLPCRKGIIREIEMGKNTVRNAKVSIFPNDSPLLTECEGLLGMQYFQNTVLVLDFENNIMWIKNMQR